MHEFATPEVQPVYQRLRAWRAGQLLIDTCRSHLYFPDDRHPRYTLPSSRHAQILVDQTVVAETDRPVLLIETGVAPRWYIPPGDVAWAQFEPVPTRTTCQYKGEASYFRVRNSGVRLWTYRHPHPEAAAIAGHLAAAGEHLGVHITVDETPERQP